MDDLCLYPHNEVTCSVLICAYNAEATLGKTIESALVQTLRNIEVIVVDDGSTDRTAEIVCRMSMFDRRLRLVRQSNLGVAAARNRAVREARGVAVAFLDSDDLWDASHLERHIRALASSDVDITFARARFIDREGLATRDKARDVRVALTPSMLLSGNPCTTCSTMVMLRSVFPKVGLFDPTLHRAEDQEWLIRAALKGCRIVGSGVSTVSYRTSPNGLSSDLSQMLTAFRRVTELVRSYAPGLIAKHGPAAEARMRLYVARRALQLGFARTSAFMHLTLAIRTFPGVLIREPRRIASTIASIVFAPRNRRAEVYPAAVSWNIQQ